MVDYQKEALKLKMENESLQQLIEILNYDVKIAYAVGFRDSHYGNGFNTNHIVPEIEQDEIVKIKRARKDEH